MFVRLRRAESAVAKGEMSGHSFIDPEVEKAGLELMLGLRKMLMDILMGVGEMTEAEANKLIHDAVSEIRVY